MTVSPFATLHHGLECPFCTELIFSMHGHDFRYCSCKYCFVDGGRKYFRYGWGNGVLDNVMPKAVLQDWNLLLTLWEAE